MPAESYYSSKSPKNEFFERMPVCKDCAISIYNKIQEKYPDRQDAIIRMCSCLDIPFSARIYEMASDRFSKEEKPLESRLARNYLTFINSSVGKNQGEAFYESENFGQIFGVASEDFLLAKSHSASLEREVDELKQVISDKDLELSDITMRRDKLLTANELAKAENIKLNGKNAELQSDNKLLKSQMEDLSLQNKNLLLEIENLKEQIKEVKSFAPSDRESSAEEIPEDYIFEWGEGFSLKEYEYLNRELASWKANHEDYGDAQDLLSREICVGKLNIRRKRAKGEDTGKEVSAIESLIKTGNFVSKSQESPKEADSFGVWIKDIEEYSPAEWIKNQSKFKDIDGIGDYLKKYVVRPLKNFVTGSRDFDPKMDLLNKDDSSDE